MRQVVVDFARRRNAEKRGSGKKPINLDVVQVPVEEQPEVVLAIDAALKQLQGLDQGLATVFECRYFLGMTDSETAEELNIALRTVQRGWMKSKAVLRLALAGDPGLPRGNS